MIALLTAALLAVAVQETGSIIRPRGESAEPRGGPERGAEARRVMVAYSRCLVLPNRRFAAVTPAFRGCLTAGVELRFSRALIRGLVAESLYRLTEQSARAAGSVR
jgi:hypothetical protein